MELEALIVDILFRTTGKKTRVGKIRQMGGGCINNAVSAETSEGFFFIKYNDRIPLDMFEKEFAGLTVLKKAGVISIPEPLGYGHVDKTGYIIMQEVKSAARIKNFWNDFGRKLALLHRNFTLEKYGLDHDNYIGRLHQVNTMRDNWIDFFVENRLSIQLQHAINNHLIDKNISGKFELFYEKLPGLLPAVRPSLLHGDLWSGNFMTGNDGKAVLIDPAVYYGHREAELSFTYMFGGFDNEFYNSYEEIWPLEKGFSGRIDIYNLYPALVHLNLFGPMYLAGITRVINHYA